MTATGKIDTSKIPKSRITKYLNFGKVSDFGGSDHRSLRNSLYNPVRIKNHINDIIKATREIINKTIVPSLSVKIIRPPKIEYRQNSNPKTTVAPM
ncbi:MULTISPECIES: hypothetical protein [Nostocales]|uniref:hypothetical protein n=1 Tax=Nostocales TaxID=1161 RepID=UPI00144779C8|nr:MULTISPECIES: hypothetical protein [Nostocales]MBO1064554.1 hypothetical protein [Anabaena sp. 54]